MNRRILLLALAGGACGDSPSPSGTGTVDRVAISPTYLEMTVGETRSLTATAYNAANDRLDVPVTWQSSSSSVATVSNAGLVAAVSPGNADIGATAAGVTATAPVLVAPQAESGPVVTVNAAVTYQTMTGWEGVAQIGEVECNRQAFGIYRPPLITRLVSELGINRVRLPLPSGSENPVDWYAAYVAGNSTGWRDHRYEILNDNADPRVANPAGFQFTVLDYLVDSIVQPLRAALSARGEHLYVNLNYTDFGPSAFEHSSNPEEYAEFLLEAFRHLQGRYGWVPDAVEVILEPDNTTNWRPATIGAALITAGDRLKAAGFQPAFIAPSNKSMSDAVSYFDQMITIPRVREYLTDLSYHRYAGVSASALDAIRTRALQFGLRTSMLEHIGSGYEDLHEDLKAGMNSAWQQFTLAYCGQDNGGAYYVVDQSNPLAPTVAMGNRTRYLRQYFAFIRGGAVRVGAATGDSRFDPLAFRNPDGKLVVVVKASGQASLTIRGIPSGQYGLYWTTASQSFATSGDLAVSGTAGAAVTMPAMGVLTLVQR